MAKNKQCSYCGTKDRKEEYRRLPNGVYACVSCHRNKNPLWMAGAVDRMSKMKKADIDILTPDKEKEFKKAVEKAKTAPPMHHTEANPIIRQAYRFLMKGKRVDI